MWILIKFAILICTFIYRYFSQFAAPSDGIGVTTLTIKGDNCYIKQTKSKNRASSTTYTFQCEFSHLFSLSPENRWDILFKDLNLTTEIQTGDADFDQKIYIACDHHRFSQTLISDPSFRDQIKYIFSNACEKIHTNSKSITFKFTGDVAQQTELMNACHDLMTKIKNIPEMSSGLLDDPLAIKIFIIESLIWSLAIYGFMNVAEYYANRYQDLYLYGSPLIYQGLGLALALFFLLLFFIIRFFQLSSRGHRIIVESFIVLLLGLPAASISMLSDLNIYLDSNQTKTSRVYIMYKSSKTNRGRRSSTTSYHITVKRSHDKEATVYNLNVPYDVYNSVTINGEMDIEISPGYFNHPWYKSMKAVRDF